MQCLYWTCPHRINFTCCGILFLSTQKHERGCDGFQNSCGSARRGMSPQQTVYCCMQRLRIGLRLKSMCHSAHVSQCLRLQWQDEGAGCENRGRSRGSDRGRGTRSGRENAFATALVGPGAGAVQRDGVRALPIRVGVLRCSGTTSEAQMNQSCHRVLRTIPSTANITHCMFRTL